MHRRVRWLVGAGLAAGLAGCESLKALVVENYPNDWDPENGKTQVCQDMLANGR